MVWENINLGLNVKSHILSIFSQLSLVFSIQSDAFVNLLSIFTIPLYKCGKIVCYNEKFCFINNLIL